MMLMKYFKIYDDELCPCGSGKTYLECCKNRKDRPVKKSKKPLNIQIMELILSILVDTFISKISFPMQPGPEIGSISDA